MKSNSKYFELPLLPAAALWFSSFAVFAGFRYWLSARYGEPPLGLGTGLFAALIMALALLMVDPPQIRSGSGLVLSVAVLGVLFLYSGETLLWLRAGDKSLFALPGYALLITGALVLLAPLPRRFSPVLWQCLPLLVASPLALVARAQPVATSTTFSQK